MATQSAAVNNSPELQHEIDYAFALSIADLLSHAARRGFQRLKSKEQMLEVVERSREVWSITLEQALANPGTEARASSTPGLVALLGFKDHFGLGRFKASNPELRKRVEELGAEGGIHNRLGLLKLPKGSFRVLDADSNVRMYGVQLADVNGRVFPGTEICPVKFEGANLLEIRTLAGERFVNPAP